jgi:hypothetical protein
MTRSPTYFHGYSASQQRPLGLPRIPRDGKYCPTSKEEAAIRAAAKARATSALDDSLSIVIAKVYP